MLRLCEHARLARRAQQPSVTFMSALVAKIDVRLAYFAPRACGIATAAFG